MNEPLKLALVGIGGYGSNFVNGVLDANDRDDFALVAVADPFPAACTRLDELVARAVPVYTSIEAMLADHTPDLVVIASPIHVHCDQTVAALESGAHVLCEKPLCATREQIDRMIDARDRAGRKVAIGYQWSYSPAFIKLRRDIATGDLGVPHRLSTLVCWPRDDHYYNRNRWAGRQHDDATGAAIFDSPVNNACAHYLHIMMHLLGDTPDCSAVPAEVSAELYRANAIENYDTAAIRFRTTGGVEIGFYATHATARVRGPLFRYEFENATVTFDDFTGEGVVARFDDGSVRQYGTASSGIGKLWDTIEAIRNDRPVKCSIEAALGQTLVMTAAQRTEIVPFPKQLVRVIENDGCKSFAVDGLEETLYRCYREYKLPSELGVPWAAAAPAMARSAG